MIACSQCLREVLRLPERVRQTPVLKIYRPIVHVEKEFAVSNHPQAVFLEPAIRPSLKMVSTPREDF